MLALLRAAGETTPETLLRLERRLAPHLYAQVLAAWQVHGDSIDLNRLAEALLAQSYAAAESAMRLPQMGETLQGRAQPPINSAFAAGGEATAADLRSAGLINARFDLLHPGAVEFLRTESSRRITRIDEETRQAIRTLLGDALERGRDVHSMARQIRDRIGLNAPQALYMERYRARLERQGVDRDTLERKLTRETARQIRIRADMIARTETLNALHWAQDTMWRQATEQGLLDAKRTRRVWMTARDERRCPICAELHGKTATLTGSFPGGYRRPPAHPRCRCSIGLRFDTRLPEATTSPLQAAKRRNRVPPASEREVRGLGAEMARHVDERTAGPRARYRAAKAEFDTVNAAHAQARHRYSNLPTVTDADKRAFAESRARWEQAFNAAQSEKLAYSTALATEAAATVKAVRPSGVGNEHFAIGTASRKAPRKLQAQLTAAEQFFPDDWVQASNAQGSILLKETTGRGSYRQAVVKVRPGAVGLTVHELGHRVESTNPRVARMEQEFFTRRTASDPRVPLKSVPGMEGYQAHEVGKPDQFWHPYIGREYSGPYTEVLSMGGETLFGPAQGAQRIQMWEQDPDFRDFILGMFGGV